LLAHQPNRNAYRSLDQGFAARADKPDQRLGQGTALPATQQPARQHQTPDCRIGKDGLRTAKMRLPAASTDFFANKRVAHRSVGNAQQGLRQAHQCNALLAGERELVDQIPDGAAMLAAQVLYKMPRQLRGWRAARRPRAL